LTLKRLSIHNCLGGIMAEEATIQALKKAILLERQSRLFYEQVAAQTRAPAVRELFQLLSAEEEKHVQVLSRKTDQAPPEAEPVPDSLGSSILNADVRRQITAASYEAAAISAALELENRAVAVYSERAETATEPGEKALYRWLAQWEREHQRFLAQINRELIEEIWNDSRFWPF
jgi:rubrerythrin